uniref:Bm14383 n=1 Tax=Brugia malayi TaxID=6279 RepID=A0A1I9G0W4_BRUMA|nr:Bm14383 [Brugia malayi]
MFIFLLYFVFNLICLIHKLLISWLYKELGRNIWITCLVVDDEVVACDILIPSKKDNFTEYPTDE